MKKRLLMMSGLLVLILALGVYQVATEMQATAIAKPTLTFDEDQAVCICKVWVAADNGGKEITAVIRLREDEKSVEVWEASSTGILNFSETAPAAPGHTYRMTVDVKVDGRRIPKISIEETYGQ